jgi:hypothetical protein
VKKEIPAPFLKLDIPPEIVDSDLMQAVYITIDQNDSADERCFMKVVP